MKTGDVCIHCLELA